jgi:RNA polymerase sigma factor (sigma-70 family)
MSIAALPEQSLNTNDVYVRAIEMRGSFTAYALRYVGGRADAEDVVQDFYMRVLRTANGPRQQEQVPSWLFIVLRSALTDHFRREHRRSRFARDEHVVQAARGNDEDSTGCGCLFDLLTTLRPPYAEMIQHIDLDEKSVEWTAALCRITPNNVRVRLFRARKALRTELLRRSTTCPARAFYDCCVQKAGRDTRTGFELQAAS